MRQVGFKDKRILLLRKEDGGKRIRLANFSAENLSGIPVKSMSTSARWAAQKKQRRASRAMYLWPAAMNHD